MTGAVLFFCHVFSQYYQSHIYFYAFQEHEYDLVMCVFDVRCGLDFWWCALQCLAIGLLNSVVLYCISIIIILLFYWLLMF